MSDLFNREIQLKLKQGLATSINTAVTKRRATTGEPHYATDTKELYIFDGTDNISINNHTASLSAVGPTDDLDVLAVNTVFIDASGGNVTLGGLTGGVAGQVIHLTVNGIGAGNTVTIEHNEGTANQNIFLESGADDTLVNKYGGWILACDGSDWYETGVH